MKEFTRTNANCNLFVHCCRLTSQRSSWTYLLLTGEIPAEKLFGTNRDPVKFKSKYGRSSSLRNHLVLKLLNLTFTDPPVMLVSSFTPKH